MDEVQRTVLALFPIGYRADLQPQKLLAQLAHPGGPTVVDVFVLHTKQRRQFQRPAGRDQINGGKIPGGGYSSVTPSRCGPRTREDASDKTLDNCCACGHESCSLTSRTLGSLAMPWAIAVSSRRASEYGGSGISVGNSRSSFGHFGFRELIDCNLMLECLQDGVLLRGGVELLLGMLEDGLGGDRKSTRLNSSHANISYAV